MNLILVAVMVMMVLLVGLSGAFLMFTRQGKNIVITYIQNKKYVICHVKKASTGFIDEWKVVPKPDYITKVGSYDYDLNPRYAVLEWKKRLHFMINEGDVIPQYLSRTDSNEEILIQVQEVRTALHNTAYDFLYRKNQNLALLVAFAALFLVLIALVYAVYEIQKVDSLLSAASVVRESIQVK